MGRNPLGDDPVVEWDDENEAHIAEHSVETWEVDEMIDQGEYEARAHPKRNQDAKFRNRFILEGETLGGRALRVVVERMGPSRLRPVTAWEPRRR